MLTKFSFILLTLTLFSSVHAEETKKRETDDLKDKIKRAEETIKKSGKKLKEKVPKDAIQKIDETFSKVREKLQRNYLALKGGVSSGIFRIDARENTSDQHTSWGVNTHFGYHWHKWEFTVSSFISFGTVEALKFKTVQGEIEGDGDLRYVSITPNIRYYTDWMPVQGWRTYFGLGPIWSLKSINFENFTSTGDFTNQHKLTYESRGAILLMGVEELLPDKKLHPVYFEVAGAFTLSRKVNIVDATNSREIEIVSEEQDEGEIQNYALLLSLGITFF